MTVKAIVISAFVLALGASAATARTGDQTGSTATNLGPLKGPLSQAQLIAGLQAHGYTDIKLSADVADPFNPHPEQAQSVSSPRDPKAQITPLHLGWNGTAVKDGRTYDVYLRAEAPRGTAADVPGARRGGVIDIYLDRVERGAH